MLPGSQPRTSSLLNRHVPNPQVHSYTPGYTHPVQNWLTLKIIPGEKGHNFKLNLGQGSLKMKLIDNGPQLYYDKGKSLNFL